MPTAQELQNILREFNLMGYADSSTKYEDNGKGGKILVREKDGYKYEDEFYGGEPYSGNETIWLNYKDVFRCVYWGKVANDTEFSSIYDFLRKALFNGPTGSVVHRGPESYKEGNLTYTNECLGTIEDFQLIERIFLDEREVYTAYFNGGRINVRG